MDQSRLKDMEIIVLDWKALNLYDQDFKTDENKQELLENFNQNKFEDVLSAVLPRSALSTMNNSTSMEQIVDLIQSNTHSYITSGEESEEWRQFEILLAAVSSLQLFVQNNWTGPPTQKNPVQYLSFDESQSEKIKNFVFDSLQVDGESVYPLSKYVLYLWIAKSLLQDCRECLSSCTSNDWWLMRCLMIQQKLLKEGSPTLKTSVLELIDKITKDDRLLENNENRNLKLQFYLEAHAACMFYFENSKAKEYIEVVRMASELQVDLSGALGTRSRYQTEDKAQLILKVSRPQKEPSIGDGENTREATETGDTEAKILPKDLSLDDDTFLNKIKFKDEDNPLNSNISGLEQAVVLGTCLDMRYNNPAQEKLTDAATLAFVNTLLHNPQDWCVQTVCLIMRSKLERDSSRRVERSMTQLEELYKQFDRPEPDCRTRTSLVYSVNMPPRWQIQEELGELFMKLGCVSSAMEAYQSIENWDKLIVCYAMLDKKEKAEKLIRERLAIKETPDLWCYLGEVLEDEQYYFKAWELSKHRSGRSQKLLGFLYLRKERYKECVECFEKSLRINHLQIPVWYSCGCACLMIQDYTKAAKAFRTCVNLNSDNFEAWNNLSLAYIRSDQKSRAFSTLLEALKCDYHNWRIWENSLITAIDVGEFAHVIKAYNRLLDVKNKHEDSKVLEILVKAINQDLPDAKGQPASTLRPKALALFGRITSKVTNNSDIWYSYSELVRGQENLSMEDEEKGLQHLQKSHRCLTLVTNWEKEIHKCEKICKRTIQLAEAYTGYCQKCENPVIAAQTASACKLMLNGVISKIKQKQLTSAGSVVPKLQEDFTKMEDQLKCIVELISNMKTS